MRNLYTLFPLFIVLGVSYTYASALKSKPVYDFSKGCDTYHSSLSLPDGYVANSQDVLFDDQAPVSKRNGYTTAWSINISSEIIITQSVNDKFYFRIGGLPTSPVIVPSGAYSPSDLITTINSAILSQTIYSDTMTWTGTRFQNISSGGHILQFVDRSIGPTLGFNTATIGQITAPNPPIFSQYGPSFQGLWTYTDPTNTTWQIARTSAALYADNLTGAPAVLIATVSANNLVGETNSQGYAFFVDQTQGVYVWNGSSMTYISGSPLGSLITSFHGRVWVSGAAVPNGNQLYGSAYLNGFIWAPNLNPNDPVQLTVGLQDNFDNITAMYVFWDTMYTFKHYSTYALTGYDQTSFAIGYITQECGCIDQASIQTFNHGLDFMSERGVEFFNGYTCTRISDPMKDKVNNAIANQGGTNSLSWVQSQTVDWLAGTLVSVSTSVAPPGLTLSQGTYLDNSTTSFNAGTLSNTQVNATPSVSLIVDNNATVSNPSFETGDFTGWTPTGAISVVTSAHDSFGSCPTVTPESGSYFASASDNPNCSFGSCSVQACVTNGNCVTLSPVNGDCSWHQVTIPVSSFTPGQRVSFNFIDSATQFNLATGSSYVYGGALTFYYRYNWEVGSVHAAFALDNIQSGVSSITSGSFTSSVTNTQSAQTILTVSTFSTTVTLSTPTIIFQTAPDGVTWTDITNSTGPGTYIAEQYIRYISSFNTAPSGDALDALNAVGYIWSSDSGTFVSQIHNVGSITSWGNFAVQDQLNGGMISFDICSSPNSNMSGETCAVQVPNSQILIPTNTYVQWNSTFTVSVATQTPTLNSATVQWFSGNRSAGMASTVWDDRYWLALSTNTSDSFNDAILVLNIPGAWAPFNIQAGGLTQYKNSLYIADAKPTGNVYLYGQGYNDNGAAINAFIRSKDYAEDSLSTDDYYDSMYVSEKDLGNYNTEIEYFMDSDLSSPYVLSSINQTEFLSNAAIKIPFLGSNQDFGKCIALEFEENDLNSPWNFYGWELYYHPREPQ